MPTSKPLPVEATYEYLATAKWMPWFTVVAPAISVLFLAIGQDRTWWLDWVLIVAGVLLLIVAGGLQYASVRGRELIEEATNQEITDLQDASEGEAKRFRVAVQHALQPVAELIAGMAATPAKGARQSMLQVVCTQAVGAVGLLLEDVDQLRAVVYGLDENGDGMTYIAYHGRGGGKTPRPFRAGTERGDLALQMVRRGGNYFAPDLDADIPEGYKGTGSDYRTFTSVAISNGETAYGMITVDAPTAGDLVPTDQQVVMLMADLLAIAFAEADR